MVKKLIIIAFVLLGLVVIVLLISSNIKEQKVITEISSRLHITPSWDAIRMGLDGQFTVGMTREEVHKILDKIGQWTIYHADSPDNGGWDSDTNQYLFREIIRFNDQSTFSALSDWDFLYDKNGNLVRQGPIDYG